MKRRWVWTIVSITLVVLLAGLLPAAAQEATEAAPVVAEETSVPASGLGTLMLLIGVGAVLIVGGVALARDAFQPGREVD